MEGFESVCALDQGGAQAAFVEAPTGAVSASGVGDEVLALNGFHGDEPLAVLLEELVEHDKVGMSERLKGSELASKAEDFIWAKSS
jgi:hypothetical protein